MHHPFQLEAASQRDQAVHELLTGCTVQHLVIFTTQLLTDVHLLLLRCLQVGSKPRFACCLCVRNTAGDHSHGRCLQMWQAASSCAPSATALMRLSRLQCLGRMPMHGMQQLSLRYALRVLCSLHMQPALRGPDTALAILHCHQGGCLVCAPE